MELNQREKAWLILATVIFVPLILFRFVVLPLQEYQTGQRLHIIQTEDRINEINMLGEELKMLNRETQNRSVSLSKRVDSLLKLLKLATRSQILIEDTPGKEQRVIIKLNEINLNELVNFVYKIEHSKPVIIIDNLDISQSFQNKKLFRVSSALSSN